jgi:hypothetical protein
MDARVKPAHDELRDPYFLSATIFNCINPLSKSGPTICSML